MAEVDAKKQTGEQQRGSGGDVGQLDGIKPMDARPLAPHPLDAELVPGTGPLALLRPQGQGPRGVEHHGGVERFGHLVAFGE